MVELDEAAFERVYLAYPRREGKSRGRRLFAREVRDPQTLADLLRAVDAYRARLAEQGTERKYIKHFDTFLGCWRDYLEPDAGPAATAADARGPTERALDEYHAARERLRAGSALPGDRERVEAWEQKRSAPATAAGRRE